MYTPWFRVNNGKIFLMGFNFFYIILKYFFLRFKFSHMLSEKQGVTKNELQDFKFSVF